VTVPHFIFIKMARNYNAIKYKKNTWSLQIDLARGEETNRAEISDWVLRHYGDSLENTYQLWFVDKSGHWAQIGRNATLKAAFEL